MKTPNSVLAVFVAWTMPTPIRMSTKPTINIMVMGVWTTMMILAGTRGAGLLVGVWVVGWWLVSPSFFGHLVISLYEGGSINSLLT